MGVKIFLSVFRKRDPAATPDVCASSASKGQRRHVDITFHGLNKAFPNLTLKEQPVFACVRVCLRGRGTTLSNDITLQKQGGAAGRLETSEQLFGLPRALLVKTNQPNHFAVAVTTTSSWCLSLTTGSAEIQTHRATACCERPEQHGMSWGPGSSVMSHARSLRRSPVSL